MIRAVIFDMDGLMFETERVAFQMLQTACAKRGLQFTIDMKRQMCGANFKVSAQIFENAFGAIDPTYTYDICWSGVRKKMEKMFAEQGVPCKSGLRKLLAFLSASGIKTAVASGSARHVVQKYIEMADLAEYFPVIIGVSRSRHQRVFCWLPIICRFLPRNVWCWRTPAEGLRLRIVQECMQYGFRIWIYHSRRFSKKQMQYVRR